MKASIYTRPNKTKYVNRREMPRSHELESVKIEEPLIVHAGTDCHVTPHDEAARMVDYANLESGMVVCEPSAGTGNILNAIIETGEDLRVIGNELNHSLFEVLRGKFEEIELTQFDFLQMEGIKVDRFIMNPPYAKRQAYKHIEHARTMLKDDGVIIALVPSNFEVSGMYEIERLARGTFASTAIETKIVEIEK